MRNVRVASVQMEHVAGDKAANFAKVQGFARAAAEAGCEVVVCPECCLTGYWFLRHLSREELLDLAEPVPDGAMSRCLRELSGDLRITVGAGLVERGFEGHLFNCYVVAMPDGTVRRHREVLQEATQAFMGSFRTPDFGKSFTPMTCFMPLMLHDLTELGLTDFPAR